MWGAPDALSVYPLHTLDASGALRASGAAPRVGRARSARRSLEHALDVDGAAFGDYRCVNAPGGTVSVEEMLAALARHGGDRGLVDFVPDPAVAAIVGTWPARFDTSKAAAMGFPAFIWNLLYPQHNLKGSRVFDVAIAICPNHFNQVFRTTI